MNKSLFALLAVAVLAASGGYFAAMHFAPAPGTENSEKGILDQSRPGFSHLDTAGRPVSASDFNGQVLLVNFWATWCAPCVEEMPMLSRMQQRLSGRGFQVVGIALDDPGRAAEFAAEMDLAYPVLVGGTDVVLTGKRYGNDSGMLPYSVLTDREGVIRWTLLGALEEAELTEKIESLLQKN